MADLTAKFKLIDEMSSKLGAIGDSGERMVQQFDRAGTSASQVFDRISTGSARSVTSASSVANAVGTIDTASTRASASASSLSDAVDEFGDAAGDAAEQTDYWTDAIGNYDKDAMEAIYTTQELVDMGFKTEAALEAEAQAMEAVGDSSSGLADAAEDAAQAEAELAEQFDETGAAGEEAGKKGVEAIDALESALQAAGIVKLLHEIYEAFKECSEAAAEVETMSAKVETIANTTVTSMGDINRSVTALSNDTGKSATALLDSTYNAISAGVDTANAVEFVAQANELAVGGFTSATTAVDVLTTSLNAYQLSADKAGQISDYLITTQNLGKTTVDELAQSVGKVIPVASAYNVQMDNLSTAYATMTANGIATLETGTYLRAMLTELGSTSSNVSKILVEETGQSFAQLSAAGYSLGDVMQILGDSVHGDATAFANLWQSSTAGVGALSLFNAGAEKFNSTLNQMQNSAGAAAKAYDTMASTTAAAQDRMTAAGENLAVSVGSAVNPALTKMYDSVAKVKGGLAEFLSAHPGVVKAGTALAIGFGTAATGIAGFVTVTKVVIPLVKSLGKAFIGLEGALGPAGWVAIGITAVVAAGTALIAMMDDAVDMSTTLTATTQAQYTELHSLEKAYDEACAKFGDTSDEASRLKYQIDDLSASIEQNGQTLEQSRNSVTSFAEEYSRLTEENEKTIESTQNEGLANLALIAKLEDLASQTDTTAESQEGMRAIIDQLNRSMGGLNITYEDFIANTSDSIAAMREFAKRQAENERRQAEWDDYIAQLNAAQTAEQKLQAAQQELEAATTAYQKAAENYQKVQQPGGPGTPGNIFAFLTPEASEYNAANAALQTARENVEDLQNTLDSATAKVNAYEEAWGWTAETTNDSAAAITDWQDAAQYAIDSVDAEIQTLIESYQAAYDAALTSFQGQFSLFDTAQADMSATVAAAQAALDSQLQYWTDYTNNVNALKELSASDLGITQENYNALMAYVQSGTEEAAGLAASMVSAINSGDQEAIATLANTLAQVKSQQEQAASATADWVTDFSGKMDEVTAKMESTIDGLNLDGEASAAAKATIQAYAQAIRDNQSAAVSAAQQVASAVAAALRAASTNISVGVSGAKTPGHAEGTTNAEDVFVAGEKGPELVVDHAGATVFPTEETEKIVQALERVDGYNRRIQQPETGATVQSVVTFAPELLAAMQDYIAPVPRADSVIIPPTPAPQPERQPEPQEKTIRLEINGTGAIEVGSGTTEDEVLEVLTQNLRPVLLSIIQAEVFEEGDGSYDY